jgi:hypothetical protein
MASLLLHIAVLALLSLTIYGAEAQTLTYARTFDASGNLVGRDSIFDYHPPHLTIAVKFKHRVALGSEELYVIVKDVNGTVGRFLMKRSNRSASEANGLVRLTKEGIFRIYVYDPVNRNMPLAVGRVFVTGQLCPSREALIVAQRNTLIQRGVVQGTIQPVPTQRTGQLASSASVNTQTASRPQTSAPQASARPQSPSPQSTTQSTTQQPQTQSAQRPTISGSASSAQGGDDFSADMDGLNFDDDDDADLGSFSETDFRSLDQDLHAMDTELHEAHVNPNDFGGNFESFDAMDDDFDFQINDF